MKKFAVILTVIAAIFSVFLGIYIYRKVQEQLEVQAKCPPTVTGIKSIPFELAIKTIVKNIPKGSKRLDLWMPYPKSRKAQGITNVSVKSPYPVEVNHDLEYGNAILHIGIDNPKDDFNVEMSISAVREESVSVRFIEEHSRDFINNGDYDVYLKEDSAGKVTPELVEIFKKETAEKELTIDKAKAVYNFVMASYEKDFENKYLPEAGRCVEINTLYGAILRAGKIPVRFVNGFTFKDMDEGPLSDYGCRSEFYASGYGWIPVDLESGKKFPDDRALYFGNLDQNRIELADGRDIKLVPPQKGEPIDVFIYPYAELDGKVFQVGKEISWKKEL